MYSGGHFRWDINAIDKFPEYMKKCFLAVFNTTNEAAFRITKEKGLDILPYLKRAVTYHRFLYHLTTPITLFPLLRGIHCYCFSGEIYAKHTWWKQNGTSGATYPS